MLSGCCVTRLNICIPRGDDRDLTFVVRDSAGDEVDISGAQEIVFIIATGVVTGGNVGPGGTVLVTKKLSDGDIQISTNDYMFSLTVTHAESDTFPKSVVYHECQITDSVGEKTTLFNGPVTAIDTMIRSI